MKLLILTQKIDINDDVLGFMHGWVAEFAKHCEKVTVVCLRKGEYDLPKNVRVLSLGKEREVKGLKLKAESLIIKVFRRFKYVCNFYKYIWRERKNYDSVFVHMNAEYAVLGGLFWRLFGKRMGLWYTHKRVSLKLKMAEKLAHMIFTATRESFRLPSDKVFVTGHGIDTGVFSAKGGSAFGGKLKEEIFKIITVGRISPVKDYETLIKAANILRKDGLKFKIDIVGGPGTPEQTKYFNYLENMVYEEGLSNIVNFVGSVANKDIVGHLRRSDLFVNMSHTGSLDKAILEAMACELPVLTCNEAAINIFNSYGGTLFFEEKNSVMFAKKIKYLYNLNENEARNMGAVLRRIIEDKHDLKKLIEKIIAYYRR